MTEPAKVIIRQGKRLPFTVLETATFEISLGKDSALDQIDGTTIPSSWTTSSEEAMKITKRPVTVMVLGGIDSGKTSFCTYLTNKAIFAKRKIAILDCDLGQSDIGPPSTIAYTFVTKPVTDLFNLHAKDAFFVGVISPSKVEDKLIDGLVLLKEKILAGSPDIVLVNTDGWIEGECAVNHKVRLVGQLHPDIVFYLRREDQQSPLTTSLGDFRTISVETPLIVKERSIEKRRDLRELGYKKYLKNAKVLSLSLSWVTIEGGELLGLCRGSMSMRKANTICSLLGMKPLHLSEQSDKICMVIGRRRWIDSANIKKVEEFTRKKVEITRKGQEEGLLVGVYDLQRRFLGVGVLQEIDYLRKTLKLCTPVPGDISSLMLGKVKLDKNLKEIEFSGENEMDFASFKKLF